MTWMVKAQRHGQVVDVTIINADPTRPIGPFVIRTHPPLPHTPVRVDHVGDGAGRPTLSFSDEAYAVMYVTAELLNELQLIDRIRSTVVN